MKKYITVLLFLFIFCLASFFRLYTLSSVPPSASLDEATIGYNAYSLLHTGRDEYGYQFPILLRAYDDYRPALYVYLVIPFIKLFGLSVLAVRFPSFLLSMLAVCTSFFLVKECMKKSAYKNAIAFGTMFLFAVSPWHIYISRLGHEVNAGLCTVIMAIFFFFLAIKKEKNAWMLIISSLFFSLSLYTYQSEKIFSPFCAIALFIIYFKEVIARKKILSISLLVGILVALPAVKATFSQEGMTRLRGSSAFVNIQSDYQRAAELSLQYKKQGNRAGQFIENRRFIPIKIFFTNYVSHMNLVWLYASRGKESFKAPGVGLFYPWEFLLFCAGILFFIKFRINKQYLFFLVSWIGFSFIAPAITTQSPHAMRSFTLLPAPQIIEAVGFVGLWQLCYGRWKAVADAGFLLIVSISVYYFFQQYFYFFPKEQSDSFQYALQNSIRYVLSHKQKYNKVIFSNANDLMQSYMFYLFLSHYNPQKYLLEGGTKSGGFAEFHAYDSVGFRPLVWNKDKNIAHVMLVGNITDFPAYAHVVYKGYYLDGTEGVRVVEP